MKRSSSDLAMCPMQRLYLPEALRVKGMVLAQQEQWPDAERVLGEAVTLAHPYAEASLYEWRLMLLGPFPVEPFPVGLAATGQPPRHTPPPKM